MKGRRVRDVWLNLSEEERQCTGGVGWKIRKMTGGGLDGKWIEKNRRKRGGNGSREGRKGEERILNREDVVRLKSTRRWLKQVFYDLELNFEAVCLLGSGGSCPPRTTLTLYPPICSVLCLNHISLSFTCKTL